MRDIGGLGFLVIAAGRMRGEAHAAQVRNDNRMIADKNGGQRRPHIAGVAETVQHDHRRTLPADANMQRDVTGWDFRNVKGRRQRFNARIGARKKGAQREPEQQQAQHNNAGIFGHRRVFLDFATSN